MAINHQLRVVLATSQKYNLELKIISPKCRNTKRYVRQRYPLVKDWTFKIIGHKSYEDFYEYTVF